MKNLIEIFKNYKLVKKTFYIYLIMLILVQIAFIIEPYFISKMLHVLEIK
jgi:hypothetical protein